MRLPRIRILRRPSHYEVRLPLGIGFMTYEGSEVDLMKNMAQGMNLPESLGDSREYRVWYGVNLGLSSSCKRGLEEVVALRNKVVGVNN